MEGENVSRETSLPSVCGEILGDYPEPDTDKDNLDNSGLLSRCDRPKFAGGYIAWPLAILLVSISIVMNTGIDADHASVFVPRKALTEFHISRAIEGVEVGNFAPNVNSLSASNSNISSDFLSVQSRHNRRQEKWLMWRNNASAADRHIWQRKIKIFFIKWEWQYVSAGTIADPVGWGLSRISEVQSGFKSKIRFIVLWNDSEDRNGKVSAQLPLGGFVHHANGFFKPFSLNDISDQLQSADTNKRSSEDTDPPFGAVFGLYLLGLLGGFGLALAGIGQLDRDRRFVGATLIGIGVLAAIGGSAILLGAFASDLSRLCGV
jgi:hypothetical protein